LPGYTAYFFAREEKIVLPIEFAQEEVTYLLSLSKNKIARRQNIYETVIRIILGLGAEIESLSIYKYQDNEYYTYLNLKREGENLEVSLKFTDGLKIAKRAGASIYVKEEILENEGIKVNRQILRDALRD
jgi:bifunctional DNase/RNase